MFSTSDSSSSENDADDDAEVMPRCCRLVDSVSPAECAVRCERSSGDVNIDAINNGANIVQNLARLLVLVVMVETGVKK